MLLKQSLKTQTKLKELETLYQNTIDICFSWYSKVWKKVDLRRNQGVCHMIYILFGSSLGKV